MGGKGRKPKPSPSNQKWETALGNVTKVDSPFPFIEVFTSKVAAWEGSESPDHWAHYKNICALAWTLLPQAAVSAGPGQCAAWAASPQLPTEVTTTHPPAQTPCIPSPHGAILTALGPRLCLVWWEADPCSPWRVLQVKEAPERHSFLPVSSKLQGHACPEIHSCRDLLCTALPGLPLPSGQREGPTWWSNTPQCPSPQTAAFNVANKHNHHVLIASLRAPSSFCSWGHKLLKLFWSESMIQHENSFLTQSPAVTPRCTMEGEWAWPGSTGGSSLSGSRPAKQPAPALPHGLLHQENFSVQTSLLVLRSNEKAITVEACYGIMEQSYIHNL